MTKAEAVLKFVDSRLHPVPLEWVQVVSREIGTDDTYAWPMWGTMFWVENNPESDYWRKHTRQMLKENFGDDFDEEMEGQPVFVHEDGSRTNIYLYSVDGFQLVGVHAAGYSFYDGVWDQLYEILGLKWHDDKETK